MSFPGIIDRKKALYYYKKAIELFNNSDSAWAYAHLIIDYPEEFSDDENKLRRYISNVFALKNKNASKYVVDNFKKSYGRDFPKLD